MVDFYSENAKIRDAPRARWLAYVLGVLESLDKQCTISHDGHWSQKLLKAWKAQLCDMCIAMLFFEVVRCI